MTTIDGTEGHHAFGADPAAYDCPRPDFPPGAFFVACRPPAR
jgi:hypothetical protein